MSDEVDAFIVGVPKAGTTWLANVISQNPGVALSYPKEPNIIASHQGTFERDTRDPDWSRYDECFSGEGIKIDASIHSFACPLAPSRISSRMPGIRMILCLREPVSRTVSHWKMIRETGEDFRNRENWADFSVAWADGRLRDDSHYGQSMQRWLEHFPLKQFLIIDSQRMRGEPETVLSEVEAFLGLGNHSYDLDPSRYANRATDRRRITPIGKWVRAVFSSIPNFAKRPIVSGLQARGITIDRIYASSVISKKGEKLSAKPEHYSICGDSVCEDLRLFESLTGFDTSRWVDRIERNRE